MTPSFFLLHSTEPGQRYKLSGVIKGGSIQMKKGTLESKFVLTDFKYDINVLFKGPLPVAFREGDMANVGGFLADHKDPTTFIATSVNVNHEVSGEKWIGESNVDRYASVNMVEPKTDFEYTKMS